MRHSSFCAAGDVNRTGNVAGGGRADGAINFNQPHLRGLNRRRAQSQSGHRDEMPMLHNFRELTVT